MPLDGIEPSHPAYKTGPLPLRLKGLKLVRVPGSAPGPPGSKPGTLLARASPCFDPCHVLQQLLTDSIAWISDAPHVPTRSPVQSRAVEGFYRLHHFIVRSPTNKNPRNFRFGGLMHYADVLIRSIHITPAAAWAESYWACGLYHQHLYSFSLIFLALFIADSGFIVNRSYE